MLSSADGIQLLQNIVRAIGARKTLDIGICAHSYAYCSLRLNNNNINYDNNNN